MTQRLQLSGLQITAVHMLRPDVEYRELTPLDSVWKGQPFNFHIEFRVEQYPKEKTLSTPNHIVGNCWDVHF